VQDEWYDSFEQIEQQSIMDVYLDHMTDYRCQRRARPRIDSIRWFCQPLYPYMDAQLYTTYRSLPLAYLTAERAHRELLCSYNVGLENLPYAGRSFLRIPIYKEYHYRHLIHFGRIIKQKVALPWRQRWQEIKGAWGFGRSVLSHIREVELRQLEHFQLFNAPAVRDLLRRAEQGTFANRPALWKLVNVPVIDAFLFGTGFPDDLALGFLEPQRDVHFIAYREPGKDALG